MSSCGLAAGLLVPEATESGCTCDSETLSAISASSRIVADAGTAASAVWASRRSFPRKAWHKKPFAYSGTTQNEKDVSVLVGRLIARERSAAVRLAAAVSVVLTFGHYILSCSGVGVT